MANTTEMLRLMRHAADLLGACDPTVNAAEAIRLATSGGNRTAINARANAESIAIGTASAVLRMVAAAMDDEPETTVTYLPLAGFCSGGSCQARPHDG